MKTPYLVALTIVASLSVAIAEGGDALDEPHFSLVAAQSIPIALKRFREDQPKANASKFQVYVRERTDVLEIEFVPDASPLDLKCGEKDCAVGVDSGSSVYGFGLTYVIDKATKKILEVTRSR